MDHLIQYCNEPAAISRLRDNQFLEVNDAFVEIIGYSRVETLGRTALELGLWESAELYQDTGRRLAATGTVKGLRTTLRTKSGEIRECIFSAVLRDLDGEPCCISFISDITETIRQDQRLRATEHRLRYIISHAPVVVNEFDTDGIMTMSEGSAVPHPRFGQSAIGRSMLEVFAESPAVGTAVESVLAGNTVNETLEVGGRWFEVWAEPIRRPDNTIIGGMAVSTDITARVLAEQRLEAEKDQFRTLVDNSTDIVLLADRNGGILFVNPAVEIQTGYPASEFIGATGFSKIHPDDVAEVIKSIDSAFVYPGAIVNFRFRLRTKSGEFRVFRATGKVLSGYPDRIVIQERDITAQETYEAELKLARDAAISSARLQSAFVANISHEVRTPLNVILGYLDVVADHLNESGDPTQNEYLESAARAGQRLTETISNVLDYSKVEAGLFQHHCEPMRLAEFVAPLVEQFRLAGRQKRIELRFIDETHDAVVLADEYCLSVAMRNLLDNAVKFTEGGAITVRQFLAGPEVGLEIKDTGGRYGSSFSEQIVRAVHAGRYRIHPQLRGQRAGAGAD